MSPCKILLLKLYYGRYKIYLKTEDLESISDKLNPFRRNIVLNLSDFLPIKDEEENNIINIMSQPIKLNFNIKRNKTFFIIEKYCYNSVFFISNIVSEDKKKCLSYQEFQNKEEFEDTQGVINNTYVKYNMSYLRYFCLFM
jgi:hypothetical protein